MFDGIQLQFTMGPQLKTTMNNTSQHYAQHTHKLLGHIRFNIFCINSIDLTSNIKRSLNFVVFILKTYCALPAILYPDADTKMLILWWLNQIIGFQCTSLHLKHIFTYLSMCFLQLFMLTLNYYFYHPIIIGLQND